MEFNTLADTFSTLSERAGAPQHGWMYRGGGYSVIIGNGSYRGVFVETATAHWRELFDVLFGHG